jgi:hypothetical protein
LGSDITVYYNNQPYGVKEIHQFGALKSGAVFGWPNLSDKGIKGIIQLTYIRVFVSVTENKLR